MQLQATTFRRSRIVEAVPRICRYCTDRSTVSDVALPCRPSRSRLGVTRRSEQMQSAKHSAMLASR